MSILVVPPNAGSFPGDMLKIRIQNDILIRFTNAEGKSAFFLGDRSPGESLVLSLGDDVVPLARDVLEHVRDAVGGGEAESDVGGVERLGEGETVGVCRGVG